VIGGPSLRGPSHPIFSYRPYSRSFMDDLGRTRFIPWRSQWLSQAPATRTRFCAARIRRYSLILLIVALILAVWGRGQRVRARASLTKNQLRRRYHGHHLTPNRTVAGGGAGASGSVQAYTEHHLRAHQRLSQGLAHRYRTEVTKGQFVGEIETPKWTATEPG